MDNPEELTPEEFAVLCQDVQTLYFNFVKLKEPVHWRWLCPADRERFSLYRDAEERLGRYILGYDNWDTYNGFERFQAALRNALRKDRAQTTSSEFESFMFDALSNSSQFFSYEGSGAYYYWKLENEE